jgi:hypothetical protein
MNAQERVDEGNRHLCRHCHESIISRPRKLCWACYHDDEVRPLYGGRETRFSRKGHGADITGGFKLARHPTSALPGSKEKVRVMETRARQGVCLWHPGDATYERGKRETGGKAGQP